MDIINRQTAIDTYGDWYCEEDKEEGFIGTVGQLLKMLPSIQYEITDEQAIEHLQSSGWMQSHDRILTQSTRDIIRCKDCKEFRRWMNTDITFCARIELETQDNDYCSHAERIKHG